MLEIELTHTGSSPRFLIRGSNGSARIAVLMVQDLDGERDAVWVIGLEGTNISVHPPSEVHLLESRKATEEEIASFPFSPSPSSGPTVPITELSYGEIPRGFYQAVPTAGLPPSLMPGRQYAVVVFAEDELGTLDFVA